MNIFGFTEYRPFLKAWLSDKDRGRGIQTRMVQAMNCQNSHLSRVLREELHLTLDQAFEASVFIGLVETEATYFIKMVEYERASSLAYRNKLKAEIKKIKMDADNLSKRFQDTVVDNIEREMIYYSSWHLSAIHILTAIPEFQTVAAIAKRLNLNDLIVRHSLEALEKFNMVTRKGHHWQIGEAFTHLPKTSPMNSIQHGNWRSRAVLSSQFPQNEHLHYTMVQTISEKDFETIKQIFLNAIDKYRKVADSSASEELVCLACDFFRV